MPEQQSHPTIPLTPDKNKRLIYRGLDIAHDREDYGDWWTTNPYYALRYSNSGDGDMLVAYVDEYELKRDAKDASLEAEYQNYRFGNGGPSSARKVTKEEIERLVASTETQMTQLDDFPGGGRGLMKWPENATEIGNQIFLPSYLGTTALSDEVSAEFHPEPPVSQPVFSQEKVINLPAERTARRVDTMHNEVCKIGNLTLIKPDEDVIEEIEKIDEKISYIKVDIPENDPKRNYEGSTDFLYSRLVFEELLSQVERDLVPDGETRNLAYRAIMASLNGTMEVDLAQTTTIHDITQIVASGVEKDHSAFNVAVAATTKDETNSIDLHRVNQYAAQVGFSRKMYMDTDTAHNIFPAVLVYDPKKLKKSPGNVWAVEVKEGYTPKEALLRAYILDCPAS